jgi:uncharacterized protein YndB with AHSA1/START domain
MNPSTILEQSKVDNNLKLEISRVIKADRTRVFNAWTRPEIVQKWFGPGMMKIVHGSADLRVGGAYAWEMQGRPDGSDSEYQAKATGIYKKIIPNELISFTWHGTWAPNEETLVTVHFRDVAEGTEVTLTHERFKTEESRAGHQQGWTSMLDKLPTLFQQ